MSVIFQNILTTIGQQKKAAAEAGGAPVNITYFKVGDGNGQYYTPSESQADLVNTKYTANFANGTNSQIIVNPNAANEVLYKCFIPADVGGFTIRELGLFDNTNSLILICKLPAQDKFALNSGLYQPLTFTPRIIYTNPQTQAVLTISSQVMASQQYVLDGISNHNTDPNAHQPLFNSKQNTITGAATSIVSSNLTASKVLVSDTNGKVATGNASSTEVGYLSGVTSAIQTQLNAKQATITGAATTIATSNLTVSRVLVSDTSGKVGVSSVTSTILGYIDATSSVQTQLNSKQATITGGATTITISNLTASKALVSDTNGKVAVGGATSTEVGYLSGVTSAIQTQLNGKQATVTGAAMTIVSSDLVAIKCFSF